MPSKPTILLISLGKPHIFDDEYHDLLSALRAHTSSSEVTESKDVSSALSTLKPAGVLITNPNFARVQHSVLHDEIVSYAMSGGTVVYCGLFPGIIGPALLEKHFQTVWGLPWKVGTFNRTRFFLAPQRPGLLKHKADMPDELECKAVRIKGADPKDFVYSTTPDSRVEELGKAESAHKPDEAAVVFTIVGDGHLGYIGDVGAENETTDIVLAMIGLPA
jgi:hypothetical protein